MTTRYLVLRWAEVSYHPAAISLYRYEADANDEARILADRAARLGLIYRYTVHRIELALAGAR